MCTCIGILEIKPEIWRVEVSPSERGDWRHFGQTVFGFFTSSTGNAFT